MNELVKIFSKIERFWMCVIEGATLYHAELLKLHDKYHNLSD